MKITGERALEVPRGEVWTSLFDPNILQQCIPGCESVEREGDSSYTAVTVLTIGPLKAKFKGSLKIADIVEGESCTLIFEGTGGAAGMARGTAAVQLREASDDDKDGTQTVLSYDADTQISGKLAQVGARLIQAVARKLSNSFFDQFEATLSKKEDPNNLEIA